MLHVGRVDVTFACNLFVQTLGVEDQLCSEGYPERRDQGLALIPSIAQMLNFRQIVDAARDCPSLHLQERPNCVLPLQFLHYFFICDILFS